MCPHLESKIKIDNLDQDKNFLRVIQWHSVLKIFEGTNFKNQIQFFIMKKKSIKELNRIKNCVR